MRTFDRFSHDALTPREREILDLNDAGWDATDIAIYMQMSRDAVSKVISDYGFQSIWNVSERFDAMVRAGSLALAQRCQQVGGRFV